MACHVDDIIRPRHDVQEVLFIHETGVHGVVVALGEARIKWWEKWLCSWIVSTLEGDIVPPLYREAQRPPNSSQI